jgi:hypothetical protein
MFSHRALIMGFWHNSKPKSAAIAYSRRAAPTADDLRATRPSRPRITAEVKDLGEVIAFATQEFRFEMGFRLADPLTVSQRHTPQPRIEPGMAGIMGRREKTSPLFGYEPVEYVLARKSRWLPMDVTAHPY